MAPEPKGTARKVPRKSAGQARSRATVQAILDAAAQILVNDGYDAATTNAIARLAGVSVGSLYQYFPSREAIVAELIDRTANQALGLLMHQLSTLVGTEPEVVIRTVAKAVFAAFAEQADLNRVLMTHVARVGRMDQLLELESRASEAIRLYLESIRDRVVVRNPEIASLLLVHLADSIISTIAIFHTDRLKSEALGDELADLVVRYVLGQTAPPR
jgi:AcrR family transcriptional regulator